MKDSENPFAKAQREEKEAKQRLESRKRRKSPSPPQDDSTADKAKAVAEMISARLKANAPKTAEELEAERALEREAEARRVEEEARARKERIESGRKKVVEEVVEEKKASWTLGENEEGADAEGVDEDDDDVLAEFTEVSQSTVVEETTSSIKESAALLKQKRFQNKSSAVKDFLPATTTSDDPLEGFLASFSTEGTESPMPTDIDLQRARSDPLASAFDAPQRRSNAITLDEILAGESGRGGGWESDSVVSASEEPPRIYDDEDESDDEDLTTRERVAAVQRDALQVQQEEQAKKKDLGRCLNDEGDVMEEKERKRAEKSALEVFAEQLRRKELKTIDHASQDYLKIRKNFYVVPRHLAKLTSDEVNERREADETKVRGKGCPPPVTTWGECGLPDRVHTKVLEAFGDDSEPFPIQKQALPALMSGRDVIGIAKTGSGKTLAFALPLLRHVSDQPPVIDGSEGPVALILAPARELALQIYRETKRFASVLGLRCTAVYGGAQVAQQIADLKRGAEVVVATPGRLIDILTMQQGRLIALSRVSFVVLDEADRMFDMGCEAVWKLQAPFNFWCGVVSTRSRVSLGDRVRV